MPTRQNRLAEFTSHGEPPAQACEILCEDHNGTYVPPFMGLFSGGIWRNSKTGGQVEVPVIGWRTQRGSSGPRRT
ncbi:hypothetical protein SAMN05519103_06075 [Rhizobiales bacterium GAS113]|nr:hypothetical protein SAMN05519103_06075 [Rhizobiales bacterium GAS113]